jgi:hypothetical protein
MYLLLLLYLGHYFKYLFTRRFVIAYKRLDRSFSELKVRNLPINRTLGGSKLEKMAYFDVRMTLYLNNIKFV